MSHGHDNAGRGPHIATAVAVGFVAGAVVLGIGGRIVMRVVSYAEPAPARFTWLGTLQVLATGAIWGMLTGPMILWLDRFRIRTSWAKGLLFGTSTLGLAAIVGALLVGVSGGIVAPPLFITLSAILFAMLFLVHGIVMACFVR